MSDLPLARLTPGDPENLLSHEARQRIGRAFLEYDRIRKQALSALELRHRCDPLGCADLMEYLSKGQPGIEFAESRMKAASTVLRAEAEEYAKLGLPGRRFREIMEERIDECAYSLEFSIPQKDALKAEFLWPVHQEPTGSSIPEPVPAKDRIKAFMNEKRLDYPAFAKKINTSVRTVGSVLAGKPVGKSTQIAIAKVLGTTPEDLFAD
jgi:hypothetical protein